MQIKKKSNQYMKNGTPVFVYVITGTKEELVAYKESQGDNYRENDDKEPLYFSQRICQIGAELTKTNSGRFQVLQDLEEVAATIESAAVKTIGKLQGAAQYFGLNKAQMKEQFFASMAD